MYYTILYYVNLYIGWVSKLILIPKALNSTLPNANFFQVPRPNQNPNKLQIWISWVLVWQDPSCSSKYYYCFVHDCQWKSLQDYRWHITLQEIVNDSPFEYHFLVNLEVKTICIIFRCKVDNLLISFPYGEKDLMTEHNISMSFQWWTVDD